MIIATVTGNLGKDATLRSTAGGSVLGFSVATTQKSRDGDKTHWVDCSIWGKRGESLAPYLSKGTRVCVVGELGTREHDGKTYITLRVDQLDFSGPNRSEGRGRSAPVDDYKPAAAPEDDPIPF